MFTNTIYRYERIAALLILVGLLAVLAPQVAMSQPAADVDWVQLGNDMNGDSRRDTAGFSVAMSDDGTRIVMGAPRADEAGRRAGRVRVYELDGTNWTQLGADFYGEAAEDRFGNGVAMSSDGNRIAIGAYKEDSSGIGPGYVQVHEFDGTNWTQLGTNINGKEDVDRFGFSVAMSDDGNRIIAGAPHFDSGSLLAEAAVYEFDGTNWTQLGTDIEGGSSDWTGASVAMSSDGNRVTIGAPLSDNVRGNRGQVRVYEFDGTNWTQLGTSIDGDTNRHLIGWSVAMSSDGSRIIVSGTRIGAVRVYEFDGTNWTQLGTSVIDGDATARDVPCCPPVAMSDDGNRITVGNLGRVFDFNGTSWTQVGTNINDLLGARSDSTCCAGLSVAMSSDGSRVTFGNAGNDDVAESAGQVRVYELQSVESPVLVDRNVVFLTNLATGRYLDSDDSGQDWNVDASPSAGFDRRWRLLDNQDGTWAVQNRQRSRYLDADGAGGNWNVGQSLNIGADDEWEFVAQPDGTYLIRNVFYDRYLAQSNTNNNVITVALADIDDHAHWNITDLN